MCCPRGCRKNHAYDIVFRHALALDDTGDVLAFGSTTGNVWVSEDQGDSWSLVSGTLPPVHAVRFSVTGMSDQEQQASPFWIWFAIVLFGGLGSIMLTQGLGLHDAQWFNPNPDVPRWVFALIGLLHATRAASAGEPASTGLKPSGQSGGLFIPWPSLGSGSLAGLFCKRRQLFTGRSGFLHRSADRIFARPYLACCWGLFDLVFAGLAASCAQAPAEDLVQLPEGEVEQRWQSSPRRDRAASSSLLACCAGKKAITVASNATQSMAMPTRPSQGDRAPKNRNDHAELSANCAKNRMSAALLFGFCHTSHAAIAIMM